VNALDEQKITALHHAAERCNTVAVQHLVNAKSIVDYQDVLEKTSLHYAAKPGNSEMLRALLGSSVTFLDWFDTQLCFF